MQRLLILLVLVATTYNASFIDKIKDIASGVLEDVGIIDDLEESSGNGRSGSGSGEGDLMDGTEVEDFLQVEEGMVEILEINGEDERFKRNIDHGHDCFHDCHYGVDERFRRNIEGSGNGEEQQAEPQSEPEAEPQSLPDPEPQSLPDPEPQSEPEAEP